MKRQVNKRQKSTTKRSRFSRILVLLIALSMLMGSSAVSTLAAPVETEKETEVDNNVGEDVITPDLEEPNEGVADDAVSDSNVEDDATVEEPMAPTDVEQPEDKMVARDVKAAVTITEESQLATLFPDPVFRAAVFEEVEGCSGATLKEALASFTGDIVSKGKNSSNLGEIKKINGIELLTSANKIDVRYNKITDFAFLNTQDTDRYGVEDGTDRDQGTNVYWVLDGNPFKTLPDNFGGALVIKQPATTSSVYTTVEPEEKEIVLRNEPGKLLGGELNVFKCTVGNRPAKIVELNVVKGGITTQKISDEKISYSGLRKNVTVQIGIGLDQELHYDTNDEFGSSTPGSQSFKYYVFPEFYVYDRVKVDTVSLGTLDFTKKDKDTDKVLSGAVFSLYKKDGTLVEKGLTTDRNGKIKKTGLAEGDYYLEETKAPAGYKLDKSPIKFTITPSTVAAELTGDKEITTDDGGLQAAKANEAFIAGKASKEIGLTVPTGITVKSVKVNYSSLDETEGSTSGKEVHSTFTTLAAAEADINAKKNANLITGPVSIKVDVIDTASTGEEVGATNEADVVTITGSKTWVDKVGTTSHPEVTLRLSQNGKPYPTADNQMTAVLPNGTTNYEFKDLPAYGTDGAKYTYTVSEDAVKGYTSERTKTDTGFNFKNTFINEYTELHGTKTWIDEDDFDKMPGVMHSKAKVWLERNEKRTDQFREIGGTKNKIETYSFDKLPVYSEDGKTKYTYSVKEEFESPEEAAKYRAPNYIGNNIMNVFANAKTKVYVKKVWEDKGIVDAHHPEITFHLLQDGIPMKGTDGKEVIQKLAENTTKFEVWFEDLPEYADNGKKYAYTVVEEPVAGYQSSRTAIDASEEKPIGYTFTNTRNEAGKTSITAIKDWVDYEDWAGPYPEVTIQVLQDGNENWGPGDTKVTKTIDKNKGETEAIFADLAEKSSIDQHMWEYTVKEINVPTGYHDKQTGNHITNIFENADKTSVTINKTWVAKTGETVPDITFTLYQDGAQYKVNDIPAEITLQKGTTTYKFENLPKYADNGKKHIYTVVETPVEGYTSKVTHSTTGDKKEDIFDFTNTFINEYKDIPFTKMWVDKEDTTKLPSATFELHRKIVGTDDTEWTSVGELIVLDHDKKEGVFSHLPVYADASTTTVPAQYGKEYEYKIVEQTVEGYTSHNDGSHFYNTFVNEETDITGTKTWYDAVEGTEHPEITVRLFRDGVEYESVTLQDGITDYEFTKLKKYSDEGKLYEYTIKEDKVEGYKSVVNGSNLSNIELIGFAGTKTWVDDNNAKEKRPSEITVNLLQNGNKVDSTKVSEKTSWKYEFDEEWPLCSDDGVEYEYTITEDAVAGYKSEIKDTEIINTLIPDEPGKPGEPGKPNDPNSPNSPKAVKTGDTSPILPIILLCTISGICIVGIGVKKLRKKKGE